MGRLGVEMPEHLEALIIEGDFAGHVGSVHENVKVVAAGPGVFGIAPAIGVVMEAEDEVGLNEAVDDVGAGVDFGGAVEDFFGGEPVGKIGEKVLRAFGGDRFVGFANEGYFGTQLFEEGLEMFRGGEGEVALADGNLSGVVGEGLEVALLEFGEFAADVAGVDSDVELVEGRKRFEGSGGEGEGDF